jgi:hypothetical protein
MNLLDACLSEGKIAARLQRLQHRYKQTLTDCNIVSLKGCDQRRPE